MKMFYSASSKLRNTLQGEPEQEMEIKPGKERLAEKYLSQAGHCLIATVMGRTNTPGAPVVTAVFSKTPALGVAFCPIITADTDQAKAFCAWLNSCFAWLMLMNLRSGSTLINPNWSHTQLRQVLLPDPTQCDMKPLIDTFEEVKLTPLLPLARTHEDPAREKIDRAAARAIDVPWARAQSIRDMLAMEPTISRRPIKGGNQ